MKPLPTSYRWASGVGDRDRAPSSLPAFCACTLSFRLAKRSRITDYWSGGALGALVEQHGPVRDAHAGERAAVKALDRPYSTGASLNELAGA